MHDSGVTERLQNAEYHAMSGPDKNTNLWSQESARTGIAHFKLITMFDILTNVV